MTLVRWLRIVLSSRILSLHYLEPTTVSSNLWNQHGQQDAMNFIEPARYNYHYQASSDPFFEKMLRSIITFLLS